MKKIICELISIPSWFWRSKILLRTKTTLLLAVIGALNVLGANTFSENSKKISTTLVDNIFKATQPTSISGMVTDVDGLPLPGVSVIIKGTTIGTITDINGNYSLTEIEPNAVLIFSFIGMTTQEVIVNGDVINVVLKDDLVNLQEVVAVGYGSMKKSDLTGAVVRANIKDLKEAPNTNFVQSLQGTVPGLNIGQVTSAGATPSISIRGANTLDGNESVLIILDGVIYNNSLSSINPADISSIDVLKDASSKAVYGAQAANGVILITTKKGKKGEAPKISLTSSYTTQTPTVDLRPMNRQEYLDHVRDLYWDESYLPDGSLNPDFSVIDKMQGVFLDEEGNILSNDYNWWDKGTNNGYIQENQLSITGGTEKVNYLISAGLTNQKGYIINDEFKRKSLRVNLETQATSWIKLGVQTFGSFVNQDGAEPNLRSLMIQSPILVPYDENGDLIVNPFNTLDTNPFISSDVDDYERHNYLFANIYSEIDIPFVKGLKYRFNFGNNYRIDKNYRASEYAAGEAGQAYKNIGEYYDFTFDNILTYNKSLNGGHDLSGTLLYGTVKREYSYTSAVSEDFSRLNLGYNSLEQGAQQYTYSDAWEEALLYQMARIHYKYRNKYLVTATIRRDGFSGFAENEKYAIFPSFALGWVISEDLNMPSWFNYLKARIGYGVSGNQTGRYTSLSRMYTSNAYVFGDGGSTLVGQEVNSLGNSDLRWEKSSEYNFGLDFAFLNNRISGNLDYYIGKTNDLLWDQVLPQMSGFSSIRTNLGEISNKGVELLLTSRNIQNNDFKWTTTLTFARNVNEIVKLTGADNDGDGKEDDLVASNLFIGESLGTIYNYEVDGIWQLDDDIADGYYPGTYRIVDQHEGEYDITPDDRIVLGRTEPAFRAGLMNKFEYKRWSLNIFINTVQGGKDGYLGNNTHSISRGTNTLIWNYVSEIDYWTPGNPGGEYPQSVSTPTISPSVYYDRSFVRLQDVILSYRIPTDFLKKINISDCSIYASGKNLATWTKWKGWDPETGSGLSTGGRPVMKGYSFGINLTF